jgi:Ion channel
MALSSWIAIIPAIAVLCFVFQDAFEVMLLPRRVHGRVRLTRFYFLGAWIAWCAIALRLNAGAGRERFLSVFGALSMVILFAVWAVGLILSFGVLQWALQTAAQSPLTEQLYFSGVTFFTLGYGDIVPHTGAGRALSVVEAGSGIGFLAVVIGYLPVLYQLFSRREAHVIQLDARAGSPPTATTMLIRHSEADSLEKLDDLLREWEIWGSELLESHLSYPMLVYYTPTRRKSGKSPCESLRGRLSFPS